MFPKGSAKHFVAVELSCHNYDLRENGSKAKGPYFCWLRVVHAILQFLPNSEKSTQTGPIEVEVPTANDRWRGRRRLGDLHGRRSSSARFVGMRVLLLGGA
jgi:hypothetical protein